jgi:DNA repair exonuclease SbcCD ATPase subunit
LQIFSERYSREEAEKIARAAVSLPFARGFNCLVGGLGCGKSSILYAIDFALVRRPLGRSYDYLLREGAENGKVVLQFTQNGKKLQNIDGD